MKTENRVIRWARIRAKIREQIFATHDEKRLETLIRRLHVVNADNRKHYPLIRVDAATTEALAISKRRSLK